MKKKVIVDLSLTYLEAIEIIRSVFLHVGKTQVDTIHIESGLTVVPSSKVDNEVLSILKQLEKKFCDNNALGQKESRIYTIEDAKDLMLTEEEKNAIRTSDVSLPATKDVSILPEYDKANIVNRFKALVNHIPSDDSVAKRLVFSIDPRFVDPEKVNFKMGPKSVGDNIIAKHYTDFRNTKATTPSEEEWEQSNREAIATQYLRN